MTTDRIPRMPDPNGHIRDSIADLEPAGTIDDTPAGRLVALDRDTWLTYREMYRLLTDPPDVDPQAWVALMHDQAGLLCDPHARAVEAYEAELARRMGW